MCGIVGAAATYPLDRANWWGSAVESLRHRGPDDDGEFLSNDRRVWLGHRRLAIMDLSPAGHQPMISATGELVLSYNGEIYNHRSLRDQLRALGHEFRSSCDTEVILAAYAQWGTKCLARLEGMFAFALFDQRERILFLARDRAGEKPLFFHQGAGELRFASELKGLLADPSLERRMDAESLDCLLTLGYVPGDRCILSGFNKLQPAHALLFRCDDGRSTIWRYWSPPSFAGDHAIDEEDLVDRLQALLEDAVRRQLQADVPVGILLSGGVDSSLVTAIAAGLGGKVNTYTVTLPGYSEMDEAPHAALVAQHFGTSHTTLEAGNITPDLLPQLAHYYDEPIAGSSMLPTFLLSSLIRSHCTVALGGDGGDELFGGYHSATRTAQLQRRFSRYPLALRRAISSAAVRTMPMGMRGRSYLRMLGADMHFSLPLFSPLVDAPQRRRLLSGTGRWRTVAEEIHSKAVPTEVDPIQRVTRFDFANYLPDQVLVKVDRASMASSLEIRAPFLDVRVIEFAFREVPSGLKATSENRKIILKRLAERLLPKSFDRQRKQGFDTPLNHWLRKGPWRESFEEVLLDRDSLFHADSVSQMLRGIDRGRSLKEPLFAMVMIELWRKEYGISASVR